MHKYVIKCIMMLKFIFCNYETMTISVILYQSVPSSHIPAFFHMFITAVSFIRNYKNKNKIILLIFMEHLSKNYNSAHK